MLLSITLTLFFLLGSFFLTALSSTFRRLHRKELTEQLEKVGNLFFYLPFHRYFFPLHEYESIAFATICAQNISRFIYAGTVLLFLSQTELFHEALSNQSIGFFVDLSWLWLVLILLCFVMLAFLLADYLPRILGTNYPETTLRLSVFPASIFFFLVFPFTYLFLKISFSLLRTPHLDYSSMPVDRKGLMEMLQWADLSPTFDQHDKTLMESVLAFKERIAREVMVPRVDLFSLSSDTTILEAAEQLINEGYSRTPVYRNTVDNIIGVLMYKDILRKYMEYQQKGNDIRVLEAPIETLIKKVLHTPETKKISTLLQEFRKKQLHMAIVVDEYGGTEGIVTIEDILEQIVGEIADEYDQEEKLYHLQPNGDWIVDARMNILDVEEELGINIPQEGEYDTIAGYVFHTTGMIPPEQFVIHNDQFEMEILESNDRTVEKVRIRQCA